ncbi:MAG: type II secretion system minor pseudopilin GspJ [Gammaproteobacteria bacterium]|nr:type II secretion system minor pseudopilin GspJ [Gammaproteobacteria bacterium]
MPGRMRGFTLIEILVALAVFAVMSMAVYTRVGEVIAGTAALEERTFATWVADNHLTRLRLDAAAGAGAPAPGRGTAVVPDGRARLAGGDRGGIDRGSGPAAPWRSGCARTRPEETAPAPGWWPSCRLRGDGHDRPAPPRSRLHPARGDGGDGDLRPDRDRLGSAAEPHPGRSRLSPRSGPKRLGGLQRAVLRLERDLLQATGRPIRDGFGDVQPALILEDARRIEFSRHGWRNPLELARSEVQRVAWSLDEEGALSRRFWSVLDRAQDSRSRSQTVLGAVEDLEFVLLDMEGGSWREWPPERGAPVLPGEAREDRPLPGALRVSLTLSPFGRVERLIPLARMPEVEEDESG